MMIVNTEGSMEDEVMKCLINNKQKSYLHSGEWSFLTCESVDA